MACPHLSRSDVLFSATATWVLLMAPGNLAAAMQVSVNVPESVHSLEPIRFSITLSGQVGSASEMEPFVCSFHSWYPDVTLRDTASGQRLERFQREPEWLGQVYLGQHHVRRVILDGTSQYVRHFVLNERFGYIPPGRYEMAVKVVLAVRKEDAPNLPGRELTHRRVYYPALGEDLAVWELPVGTAAFEVTPAPEGYASEVLKRVSELAKQGSLGPREVTLDDWCALALMSDPAAREFLADHAESAPWLAAHIWQCRFLNGGSTEEVLDQALRWLQANRGNRVGQIALEAFRQRGDRRDALRLRHLLESARPGWEPSIFFTVMHLLGKPTPADLGRRKLNTQDVQVALAWLDELEIELQKTGPTTRPKLEQFEFSLPTQPATQPADDQQSPSAR